MKFYEDKAYFVINGFNPLESKGGAEIFPLRPPVAPKFAEMILYAASNYLPIRKGIA